MTGLRDIAAAALRILQRQGAQQLGPDIPVSAAIVLHRLRLAVLSPPPGPQTVTITAEGRRWRPVEEHWAA